jgi:hypothetical protein
MEIVGNLYTVAYGRDNFGYAVVATLEETLEMTGVVLFLHALMVYAGAERVRLDFAPDAAAEAPAASGGRRPS